MDNSDRVTQYTFEVYDFIVPPITVDRVGADGDFWADHWAIRRKGQCLTRSHRWVWEPRPSERTTGFKNRTRFPLADALIRAQQEADELHTHYEKRFKDHT